MNKKTSKSPPRILKIRKDREYDCVYIGKQKVMLGRSGTPEAEAAYRQLQIQVLTDPSLASLKPEQVTVDNLCFAYLQYAQDHDPDHYFGIKTAVEILLKHPTDVKFILDRMAYRRIIGCSVFWLYQ
jgi:hypothetical protein